MPQTRTPNALGPYRLEVPTNRLRAVILKLLLLAQTGGRRLGRVAWQADTLEDRPNRSSLSDEGDDLHALSTALGTRQDVYLEYPCHEIVSDASSAAEPEP